MAGVLDRRSASSGCVRKRCRSPETPVLLSSERSRAEDEDYSVGRDAKSPEANRPWAFLVTVVTKQSVFLIAVVKAWSYVNSGCVVDRCWADNNRSINRSCDDNATGNRIGRQHRTSGDSAYRSNPASYHPSVRIRNVRSGKSSD